ncbi:putative gastrointestinal growth factor xP4 [Erpetoichthys calabaricus]|uniref:putative gastrointestinal growth factor xP4 n=1 Tax=Erpetoichthys calabaricus TaxID=27687 RepID=UPI002233FA83|nr:putative gastrointestinal growth factor xP4 [Erpetoichthys calabaricus]
MICGKAFVLLMIAVCIKAQQNFQQCEVKPDERVECGYPGITPDVCTGRGCCFSSAIVGVKWCFRPKVSSVCEVLPSLREDCGFPGITISQCNSRGCCFDSRTSNVIWCFKPDSKDFKYL